MADLMEELKRQEERLFNCVHCGFCLPACPTYSRLGDEADSPRGRLHFMRALVEGRLEAGSPSLNRHLDRCLGCRACESVCPSGVEYGKLLEGAREVTTRAFGKGFLARALPYVMAHQVVLKPLAFLLRVFRGTGFLGASARRLPEGGILGRLKLGMAMVAATAPPQRIGGGAHEPMSKRWAGKGNGRKPKRPASRETSAELRLGMLVGCVQEGLLRRVNQATERVLEANGLKVMRVQGQGCCGALHAHTGDLDGARVLARRNIEAFEAHAVDLVVVNAAGCGAAMKEYPELLGEDPAYSERARRLASKVRDVSELLGGRGLIPGGRVELKVTYDAPCHLVHAQRISAEPLKLLDSIPGLERRPLQGQDECCGGAGIYGITHPELGGRISGDKVRAVLDSGAEVVATGNPGCMMQIGAGLVMEGGNVDVVHPIELLDESYRRGGIYS